MLEKRKQDLEHAIEFEYSKVTVKDLFKDYEKSYKLLRNPTSEQIDEYREILCMYIAYSNRREQ